MADQNSNRFAANRDWPLVTYVLLSYNHADYVAAAIESIVNQEYSPLQLIVVDDGSTDGSVELLKKLHERYAFELVIQENGGVVAALNKGLSLAKGEFIGPHASDDISQSSRTLAQVKLLLENEEAGFTVGGIRKISTEDEILEDWQPHERFFTSFADFVQGKGRGVAVSCMYRASALREVGRLDERLSFEDVQLYWRVTELGYKCLVDTSVHAVDYRIVPGSLGRRNQVPHAQSFLTFLERYAGEDWHPRCRGRAKAGLLGALAERERVAALLYLFRNISDFRLGELLRPLAKLILPRPLLHKLKRKF